MAAGKLMGVRNLILTMNKVALLYCTKQMRLGMGMKFGWLLNMSMIVDTLKITRVIIIILPGTWIVQYTLTD